MHALEISNLVKIYENGVQALKGIDLTVKQGDFFALLGPNGAGKSTTIGIITSLVTKTSGQVKVFGNDLDTEPNLAKKAIGLVPQEFNFNIFHKPIDILINQAGFYGIPRKEAVIRAKKYLTMLDLWDKRAVTARTLSGGQKRRLMIARSLVHEPPLMILDEPTAGVDIEIRRSMWQLMQEINRQGTTIILTTHYLEEAENLCRYVSIINHGQIIENAPMHQVLKKLNRETIILYLQDILAEAPMLDNFKTKLVDDHTLEIEMCSGQTVNELLTRLNDKQITVTSFRNKSNRLEELFLDLTSKNHKE